MRTGFLRGRALCVATACALLLAACGHDDGGQPDVLARPAQWARSYGGPADEMANSVQPTADGGFVVAGRTGSFCPGGDNAWVLKLDSSGAIAGCPAMAESNAVAVDTAASIADGAATSSDTNFTPVNGPAVSSDSTAVPSEQCRHE